MAPILLPGLGFLGKLNFGGKSENPQWRQAVGILTKIAPIYLAGFLGFLEKLKYRRKKRKSPHSTKRGTSPAGDFSSTKMAPISSAGFLGFLEKLKWGEKSENPSYPPNCGRRFVRMRADFSSGVFGISRKVEI